MLFGLSHKDKTAKLLHTHHLYKNLKPGTNVKVKESGFLQIPRYYFVCLGNKDMYSIFKDILYNLCFISHKLLFIREIYHFLFKKY